MNKTFVFIALLFLPLSSFAQRSISGFIYDAQDKEVLIGATVYDSVSQRGGVTNAYGFFLVNVERKNVRLRISYIGYETQWIDVDAQNDAPLEIYLIERVTELETVTITAERQELTETVQNAQLSVIKIKPKQLKQLPSFAGESDLLKIAQLMPGVTQGNEGSTGIYVRGGTDDQNLVLLDEAVVYNVGHLLGFFSVFNSDAINDVEMITGAFPSKYGGRLSSVMDIRMADGSAERWNVNGGVGLLTSRIMIDGPIINDKLSMMVAGRRTYVDKVLAVLGATLPYYFYDLNAKINYKISSRDRVYLSSYLGSDVFYANDEAEENVGLGFTIGNVTTTLRWNHIYKSGNLFSNVTAHQTRFKYNLYGSAEQNGIEISSAIQDIGAKADWEWYPKSNMKVFWGGGWVHHQFRPNVINTTGEINQLLESQAGPRLNMDEYHVHLAHDWDISKRVKLSSGLRFAGVFGQENAAGLEPRVSMRYALSKNHSLKAGYSLMRQYMHRVSSSSIVLPTDLWYPVTDRVPPQYAHQLTVGYFGASKKQDYSWSVELFAKNMYNLIEYREGASLILNDNFERELLNGEGKSRGIELFTRKHTGKIQGWVSYTLSKTDRFFEELNQGKSFPDRFDRRHVFSAVASYELAKNLVFSATWVYMSGTNITAQIGQYVMPNPSLTGVEIVPIYSERNAVKLSPSHRLDFNLILKGSKGKWGRGEWHFSVYNFYNMASPFQVSIEPNGDAYAYKQSGIFGLIPSIAYNFNFSSR
jgi:hypothetical protein